MLLFTRRKDKIQDSMRILKRVFRLRYRLGYFLPFILVLMLVSCRKKNEETVTYTCPMHHTVISESPGQCPVCGMDLVRQARPGEEVTITEALVPLLASPNESIVSSAKVIRGDYRSANISIDVQGTVTYDTRNLYTVSARTGGRLEKVYLKYTFQSVYKGQKVAEIYSPEFITAQRELLYVLANDPGDTQLLESSKRKLSLLGVTRTQIDQVIRDKKAVYTFTVYSPHDGYIIPEDQQAPVGAVSGYAVPAATNTMGSSDSKMPAPAPGDSPAPLIRVGSYLSTGQTLFRIVNTDAVRIEFKLRASEAGAVNVMHEVELAMIGAKTEKAKIDLVQPFYDGGEKFINLRLFVKRKDLSIGQLVHGTIKLKSSNGLWLPKSAVLDLGLDKIVFVNDHGVFKPRKVTTAAASADSIQISRGLTTQENVAGDAHYLVDSESFIK